MPAVVLEQFIFRLSAWSVSGIYLTSVQPITDCHTPTPLVWLESSQSQHTTTGVSKVRALWGGMCSHVSLSMTTLKGQGLYIWSERQGHRRWAAVTCSADPPCVSQRGPPSQWTVVVIPLNDRNTYGCLAVSNTCEQVNSCLSWKNRLSLCF